MEDPAEVSRVIHKAISVLEVAYRERRKLACDARDEAEHLALIEAEHLTTEALKALCPHAPEFLVGEGTPEPWCRACYSTIGWG